MMKEQALHKFWSSFGLKAYREDSVPDSAVMPYITYQTVTDSFGGNVSMVASLWNRKIAGSDPVTFNAEKTNEIVASIGMGGKRVLCDGGMMWIKRGSPFAQDMLDPNDDAIRRKLYNISVEFITEN